MGEVTKMTVEPADNAEPTNGAAPGLPEGEAYTNLRQKFSGDNAVEQLAASYLELERRLGSSQPSEDGEQPPPEPKKGLTAGEQPKAEETGGELLSMDTLSEVFGEYNDKGQLSDATYEKLRSRGIDRSLVDNVIEGQLARAERIEREGLEVVGGRANYDVLTQWAAQNLTESELAAYNASVQSGDVHQARQAVEALAFRYNKANGGMPSAGEGGEEPAAPRRLEGATGPETSQGGYRDMYELMKDQQDPRYEQSAAFRAEVDRKARLMGSDALNTV